MNKVNFKCWSDTVRTEGTGTRIHTIRSIFCHAVDAKERAEIIESLQAIARDKFGDQLQEQHEIFAWMSKQDVELFKSGHSVLVVPHRKECVFDQSERNVALYKTGA